MYDDRRDQLEAPFILPARSYCFRGSSDLISRAVNKPPLPHQPESSTKTTHLKSQSSTCDYATSTGNINPFHTDAVDDDGISLSAVRMSNIPQDVMDVCGIWICCTHALILLPLFVFFFLTVRGWQRSCSVATRLPPCHSAWKRNMRSAFMAQRDHPEIWCLARSLNFRRSWCLQTSHLDVGTRRQLEPEWWPLQCLC